MKDINKEAFKQAEKELLEKQVNQVKAYMVETLEKIEQKKKEKATVEEELRILKLDMDNLRSGDFKKIEDRRQKSPLARSISVELEPSLYRNGNYVIQTANGVVSYSTFWNNSTSGTYEVTGRIFYF